jgi:hypothetical protein
MAKPCCSVLRMRQQPARVRQYSRVTDFYACAGFAPQLQAPAGYKHPRRQNPDTTSILERQFCTAASDTIFDRAIRWLPYAEWMVAKGS